MPRKKEIDCNALDYTALIKKQVEEGNRPAAELLSVHVKLENPTFDKQSGERTSKPVIVKYNINEFKEIERFVKPQYAVFQVLYNPNDQKEEEKAIPANAEVVTAVPVETAAPLCDEVKGRRV
jgi:hypothetical protein